MEEESFPRGGVLKKPSDSSLKKKPIEKDLFQTGDDDTKTDKGRKRKKKDEKEKKTKKQKVSPSKSFHYSTGLIQQLSTRLISTDMLILGCVKEIHEYEVMLSLPNGVSGSVPITNISDAYHEQLKLLASQSETEELEDLEVHGLHEIFKIGTVLPCKVMDIGQTKKGKTSIKLSINPKHVNQGFEASSIRDGMVLFGSVASQEDHGYVIDLGVKSVRAFLKNKDAERYVQMFNDGYPLMVGQSVMCMIQTGKDKLAMLSGESRTVSVTIDPNKLSDSELHDELEIPFRSLIPGMKITATVDKATEDGVTVKFLQYNGSIHRSHLSSTPDKVFKSKQIKVCILYIHPSTKAVVMTNLPHLVNYKGVPINDMFGQLTGGQILEDAEVMKKDPGSVLFKLPGDVKAFCGVKNLSDGKISNIDSIFKRGTKHRCRIMDFSYIDGLVSVSLKQSLLNLKYMTIQEVQPGALIECTVHSVLDKGVSVKLSPTIQGFISNLHLANSTFKSIDTKQFAEGKQLKCRVLKVDQKKRNVILTHKKMLINTKLPILTNYDQLQRGLEVEGFIAKINEKGVLVVFYDQMRGWVPRKFLSTEDIEFPEKVFFLGQVVKARVKSWDEEKKKIFLSFRIDPNFAFGTKQDSSGDDMKLGQIVSCEVLAKVETGLDVKLPSSKTAFLPTKHLTESMETSHSLLNTYNTGDVIEKVMYLSKTNVPIVTLRKAMVEYGCDQTVVTSIDDLQVGMMIPGMVKNVMSYGVFIQLVGGLVGLSPNKFALDSKIEDLNEVYKQGQSVVAKITEVDKEKNRFLVSLRMQDCYHGETNIGVNLLSSYLTEMDIILNQVKQYKGKKSRLGDIVVGQVYDFSIEDVSSIGILGHVTKDVKGIYDKASTDDEEYTVGTKTGCVVLSIDVENKCVEVTLSKHIVKAVNNKKQTKINKVESGMPVEGEVILVKKDCVIVLLKGQVSGNIAYLPSRRHLNDVMEVHQFSIGQTYPMIVKRIEAGHVLCSLEIHEKKQSSLVESQAKLQLGDIVNVSIKDIHKWQLNVTCRDVHGRIHITEILDSIEDGTNPMSPYKQNQELKARVIGFREYQPKHQTLTKNKTQMIPEFSVRPSILEKKSLPIDKQKFKKGQKVTGYVINYEKNSLWLQVTPSVRGRIKLFNLSTDQKVLENPKKYFVHCKGYNATILDVLKDNSLLELTFIGEKSSLTNTEKSSTSPIQPGETYKGVISSIMKKTGLVVKISKGGKGVVKLTEISDEYTDDPTSDFSVGQTVDCYIVSCDKATKCNLSLRKSRVRKCNVTDPVIESKEHLSVGQILRGFIVHRTKTQLLVSLGTNITGIVTSQRMSDYCVADVEAVYSVGKVVTAKVISISDKGISLSLRESVTGVKEIISEEFKKKKRKSTEKIKNQKKDNSENVPEKDKEETKHENKKEKKASRKRKTSSSDNANVTIDMSKKIKLTSDSDSGIDDVDPDKLTHSKRHDEDLPRINVKLDWCWDSEYTTPVVEKTTESDSEDDESEDSETDTVTAKVDIQKDKKEEEKKLFQFEQHQLQGDVSPEVAEDFDRLTLQSPDSSLVWLRYMAFHLETAEIEKARAVAERALKTISFREEQEKMNVWVAYLNLENMYGTPEELKKVLERALQQNDPLTVYQHLINIYSKSGKFQEAENMYNIMTRKFSYKKEPWIGFGLFYFKNGNFEAARKILPRCLKSLSKDNHVETIAKFAQMEFKHGEPERGKTMFENILSNYPKRTDLWSVYVDMVIKTGDIEAARQLLNRVIHMKLSAKKMKFFFKKFLDFEKSHGDEKHIDSVKKKAFEYVESKGFVDE